jgi:hypothetical protein
MRFSACACVVAGLALVGPLHAQTQEVPQDGAARLKALGERMNAFLGDMKEIGLYPRFGSLCPNSGTAPGLAYWKPEIGGSGIDVFGAASLTFRGDRLFELRVGQVPHRPGDVPSRKEGLEWLSAFEVGKGGSRKFLYADVRRLDVAAGGFLDGASDPMTADSYDIVGGYRITDHLSASVRAGYLEIEPQEGAAALKPAIDAGMTGSPAVAWRHEYFRVAAEVALDTRDVPRNPHAGQFASALFEAYDDRSVGGSFRRATVDLRHFQPLGSPRHVLALRALGMVASTATGTPVPFYLQRSLGGNQILRSYEWERFSGNKVAAFSAEYRFELRPRLELAAFYDLGKAWDGYATLTTPGFVSSYGAGARLKATNRVLLRLDVAHGREGTRSNVTLGYSF